MFEYRQPQWLSDEGDEILTLKTRLIPLRLPHLHSLAQWIRCIEGHLKKPIVSGMTALRGGHQFGT